MYVINGKVLNPKRLYRCGKIIHDWLIYQKHFSVFSQADDGYYLFAKTEELKKALAEMPFYLKLIELEQGR